MEEKMFSKQLNEKLNNAYKFNHFKNEYLNKYVFEK